MILLPNVQKMEEKEGSFYFSYNGNIVMEESVGADYYEMASLLKKEILDSTGINANISRGKAEKGDIVLRVDEKETKKEAYHLSITSEYVVVSAGSREGLLYGIQTLRQIIRQEGAALPALEIEDYPDLPNRGFMHDVTRSRIPTMEQLKKLVDKCSYYKLNQLQIYIEHTYLFKDFSEMWRDDTPLTSEDILELDAYCRKLNVELVPCIASFGHLYKLLRTKKYRHLSEIEENDPFFFMERQMHHTIDITNEESFQVIEKMLREFIPLFSSKQFNICSDETFDLGAGKGKKMAEEIGKSTMYINFIKRLCNLVKEYGLRPMFWSDVLLSRPEDIKELPEDIVCLNWDYAENPSSTNVKKLADLGAVQYLCPGIHGWNHLINRQDAAYANVEKMCSFATEFKAEGVLNTDWGDYGHVQHGEFYITGLIYGAAFSWNKNHSSEEEINRQISILEFGDKTGEFVNIIRDIAKQEAFPWSHFAQYWESCIKGFEKEAEKRFYGNLNISKAPQANEMLRKNVEKLYHCMADMSPELRKNVTPYLLMADGMEILNIIGAEIEQYRFGVENSEAKDTKETAERLERWYYDYAKLWRTVSRESELYRTRDMIFWYADYLRAGIEALEK